MIRRKIFKESKESDEFFDKLVEFESLVNEIIEDYEEFENEQCGNLEKARFRQENGVWPEPTLKRDYKIKFMKILVEMLNVLRNSEIKFEDFLPNFYLDNKLNIFQDE